MHYYKYPDDMARNSGNNSADMDGQIAYHNEMEDIANRAGDYTKADHHRKMQEIYKAIKKDINYTRPPINYPMEIMK